LRGKCITEGFIRPKTVELVSYSCGLIKDDHIEFHVIYRCLVCNPIKDVEVECKVKNITKAGIHAEVRDDEDNVPITIFVARDHNYANHVFDNVEVDTIIRTKIIGVRFELNDPSITAIAQLLDKTRIEEREVVEEKEAVVEENIEDRYLKMKADAEEELKEEKRIRDVFGETGPVVYGEDVFAPTTKKRTIKILKN